MNQVLTYRGLSITKGVAHIEQHFTASELKSIHHFADLHKLCDANMTLPFPEDCGDASWLRFSNAVIAAFDLDKQTKAGRGR